MGEPLDDRKRLHLAIRRAGLTYAAAAEMLGVSKSTFARMLSGKKPIEPLHKETLTRRANLPEGWWTSDLALLVNERWEALLERLERHQDRRERDHDYWRTFMDWCVALAKDAVPGIMFVSGIDLSKATQAREAAQADRGPTATAPTGLAGAVTEALSVLERGLEADVRSAQASPQSRATPPRRRQPPPS